MAKISQIPLDIYDAVSTLSESIKTDNDGALVTDAIKTRHLDANEIEMENGLEIFSQQSYVAGQYDCYIRRNVGNKYALINLDYEGKLNFTQYTGSGAPLAVSLDKIALKSELTSLSPKIIRHDVILRGKHPDGIAALSFTVLSSKNTPIDSFQDLKTVAVEGSFAVSGIAGGGIAISLQIGSAIDSTIVNGIKLDGATGISAKLSEFTSLLFTDDVKAIS